MIIVTIILDFLDLSNNNGEKFFFPGDDTYTIEVYGTYIVTNLVWWTIGGIYTYFDMTSTPSFLRKYKIQPGTNEPVDPKKFRKLLYTVFINQTIVYFPLTLLGVK